ncbi:Hist_deacetyl domain-containing protein [Meloidogyne graminicola]|uniref:histone deacetylase n=1 Tax=Meloidogyne graminicola TaxID=189291 RepID=A0A8T0A0X9_9BILA|nr:Hist_deacetyl domain-containing protein [Meloidogyne graminicola]
MDEQSPPTAKINNNSSMPNSTNNSQIQQQQDNISIPDSTPIDERLALLQEFYQRRHAELLAQFQHTQTLAQQDYLLNLQLLQSALPAAAAMVVLQQQQQQQTPMLSQQQSSTDLSNDESDLKTDRQKICAAAAAAVAAVQQQSPKIQSQQQPTSCNSVPLAVSKEHGNSNATARNRRTLSGSGQTISQHTRDRLKSMIAIKKQKQRLHTSSSAGSSSNITLTNTSSINGGTSHWTTQTKVTNSELNLPSGGDTSSVPVTLVNTSHIDQRFLPYPHPTHSSRHTNDSTAGDSSDLPNLPLSAAEFQLRKVNSEPNLKMRIRARLLNKGSSPHQQPTAVVSNVPPPQSIVFPSHTSIQQSPENVSNGESTANASVSTNTSSTVGINSAAASLLLQQAAALAAAGGGTVTTPTTTNTPQSFHLNGSSSMMMVPSPSLPNLSMAASFGAASHGKVDGIHKNSVGEEIVSNVTSSQQQQEMINGLVSLQNTLMHHFLSMPSLLNSGAGGCANGITSTTNSMLMENSGAGDSSASSSSSGFNTTSVQQQRQVRFDSRTLAAPAPQMPSLGGYPSLLKQQLRDLVLRRKSLVREEPEDDTLMDFTSSRGSIAGQQGVLDGSNIANPDALINLVDQNLKTGLAYDQVMYKHQCLCGENGNHVEVLITHGGRVQSIWSRLIESGLVSSCEKVIVRKAPLEVLRLVHSPTYVTFFAISPTACLKLDPAELPLKSFVQLPCGGIGVDSDTYFNDASTQTAAKMAVGALVELCCQVMEGKLKNGFACIRPPGHHAEREQAMGFCFFNNVAIAARYLQQRFNNGPTLCPPRIAIIDWDVHHGNGTQLCFESDPNCLYLSLHRHDNGNFFPGTGAVTEVGVDAGKGTTVNIPFSGDVMGDAEYLAAWRVIVLPILDAFKPEFILVSAGFDATKGHAAALGGYNLTPKLFGYLTRTLRQFANGRVVLALEGGYDLSSICDAAEECVKALCSTESVDVDFISQLSSESLEQVPNQSAQETIQKVIAVHKKHWPCLTGMQGINTSELSWQTISHRFSSLTMQT